MNYEEYQSHECKASPEDGCEVCDAWQEQNDIKFDEMKEKVVEKTINGRKAYVWGNTKEGQLCRYKNTEDQLQEQLRSTT